MGINQGKTFNGRTKFFEDSKDYEHITPNNLTFDEAFKLYIDYSKSKNLSPRTIEFYEFILGRVKKQLCNMVFISEITLAELRHLVSVDLERVSTGTVNHTINTLKFLFNFLEDEGYISFNPTRKLQLVKCEKKLIVPFTDEQIEKLLAAPDTSTFTGLRDYIFMVLILDTGLRLSEAVSITKDSINFNDGQIKVMGKGNKERIVPIGKILKSLLKQYMGRLDKIGVTDYIFVSDLGNDLTRNRIDFRIRYYGKKAGLTGVRCSPHTLRHTFAVNFLRNGGNVFILQRILGHTTLDMTKRYVNFVFEDIAAAHAISSPLDNMSVIRPARSTQPKRKRLR